MSPFESDSSDEGEDYIETNVLLGYATKEATGDAISHLGGIPSWLDETTPPSSALARCKVCSNLLTLLLELNADLPEHFSGHERRLYLWSCRRKACRRKEGSVRGIRGVRVAKSASSEATAKVGRKEHNEERAVPQLGESLFGLTKVASANGPSNPFVRPPSLTSDDKASTNPFSTKRNSFETSAPLVHAKSESAKDEVPTTLVKTFADKVRINLPSPSGQSSQYSHEKWPVQSSFPPPYPHYQLDAEYETLDAPSTPHIPENARVDVDAEGNGGGGKEDKEIFESTLDRTFQKFADQVGQNPEQVIRYEFKGKPLLYSDNDRVGKLLSLHSQDGSFSGTKVTTNGSRGAANLPPCQNCGADRVFEVQLTPHAITELEADEASVDGMEWGTIILGVCSNDCKPINVPDGEVGYVEEWVGVQWEEMVSGR